jgi:hypothetical protein
MTTTHILQIALLVFLVAVILRLAGILRGRSRPRSSAGGQHLCDNCQYLLRRYDDGVSCVAGGRQVFKNPTHISNCMDWKKAVR